MRRSHLAWIGGAALALALPQAAALADAPQTTLKMPSGSLSAIDQQFLRQAYSINQGEIQLGRLAQRKGTSDKVKSYGERLVKDHTQALDQLREAADQGGFALPTELLPAQQRTYDHLSRLSGTEFDRAFLDHSVSGHEIAINAFSDEAKNGQNPALKSYAARTLPVLRTHQDEARRGQAHPSS